jgi:hypothetical protein
MRSVIAIENLQADNKDVQALMRAQQLENDIATSLLRSRPTMNYKNYLYEALIVFLDMSKISCPDDKSRHAGYKVETFTAKTANIYKL